MNAVAGIVTQLVHVALMLAAAPTVVGVIGWIQARLGGRAGPLVMQPWHELRRLLRKESVLAEAASGLSTLAPVVAASAIAVAAALVPSFALGMILAPYADLLMLAGLLVLARAAFALAVMDAGTASGGIAASRTMIVACLAEPAVLLVVLVPALLAASTNLDLIATVMAEGATAWRPAVVLAFVAILLVAFADAGQRSVPLEFGGRDLALIQATDALRLLVLFNLFGAMFLPVGMAPSGAGPAAWLVGLAAWLARTLLFAVAFAVVPVFTRRLRLARAESMLGVAILLGLLAMVCLLAGMRTA